MGGKLGYINFCMPCKESIQRGKDIICTNKGSRFYGLVVNQVCLAPCFEAKSKAEQVKKNLQAMFREDPELKAAFKETLDELSKPENIEKLAKEICAGLSVIQAAMDRRQ